MYISGKLLLNSTARNGVLKRALRALVNRYDHEEDDEENNKEDGRENNNNNLRDLLELLEYLKWRNRRYNGSDDELFQSNNSTANHTNHLAANQEEFELPVALVQLLIIVLVFLIVFFMCKCNQMMERCRDCRRKKSLDQKRMQQFDEDRYHDTMTLRDYLCFMWYNFKKRRRFNKRRRRRLKNLKQGRLNLGRGARGFRKGSSAVSSSVGGTSMDERRKNSLIFKRRSVIYRNKNRKNALAAAAVAGVVAAAGMGGGGSTILGPGAGGPAGSFSSSSQKQQRGGVNVKFRPNTNSFSHLPYSNSMLQTANSSSASYGDEFSNAGGGIAALAATYNEPPNNSSNLEKSARPGKKKSLMIYFENQAEDIV